MNFFWSPSPTKRSARTSQKIRGKFGARFGAKLGTKIRKIRETFVLQLSDLTYSRSLGNGVCKMGSAINVRMDDAGSILNFRIGFSL